MWEYNNTLNSDELYHYGVLGMKWGRRKGPSSKTSLNKKIGKAIGKQINKKIEKNKKRDERINERIKKTTDRFGVGGVAVASTLRTGRSFMVKKTIAHVLNGAANAYINSGRGSYAINRGVDFARRAAIKGLSVSAVMDVARGAIDVQKAANYAASKRK